MPPRASLRPRAAAQDASADASPFPAARPSRLRTALVVVNEGTKFGVSAAALAVLLHQRSAHAALALSASVVNSLAGKALKRLLGHARPPGARKADPGMPSSHGVSLGYLATYGASALLFGGAAPRDPLAEHCLAAGALQATGLFLAALRVGLGYHTAPQVAVGYALGATNALLVHTAARAYLLPLLAAAPAARVALYALTAAAIALFAAKGLTEWLADAKVTLQAHRAAKAE
jgi:dolichyldiphosphatase